MSPTTTRRIKPAAAATTLALLLAACNNSEPEARAPAASANSNIVQGVNDAINTTTTAPAAQPADMAGWESLWAQQRGDVVTALRAASTENTPTLRHGTGGFALDLASCPAGWSDSEGLSDTEIKIGYTTAQSGTLADYGNIAKALQVQIDDLNASGGLVDSEGKARKVTLITKDDGYDAARTIPLVDELVDSERVFAVMTLGSPNTMKVYDKLNERCIPHPLAQTGHPAWGDPTAHPWTTGMQLAYNTEAVLWGAFIEQHRDQLAEDGSITVAALVMNNDFGKAYDGGFQAWLSQSPLADQIDYVTETIEPQAPVVTDAMTTLAAKSPDVFIAMVAGTPCTQAIVEAANNGLKDTASYLFQPSVCAAASFVSQEKVGGSADGWWIVNGGLKDLNSPAFDNDPYVTHAREQLLAAGIDPASSGSLGSGYAFGWPLLQTLEIAGQLPGGLTRSNFTLALRAMNMTHPFLLPGVQFNMNGQADAYLIEGGIYQRRDAASETWVDQGAVIDLSGKSGLCAWSQTTASCQ